MVKRFGPFVQIVSFSLDSDWVKLGKAMGLEPKSSVVNDTISGILSIQKGV